MEEEILRCVDLLRAGKVILYPTDTVWGIGCDATNEDALNRLYVIKHRQINKSMLVLLDRAEKLPLYVEKIPLIAWDLLNITDRPTTYIYPTAKNLPPTLIHPDGSIAIRIIQDPFCKKLVHKLNKPIVSTSANLSGNQSPLTFSEIDPHILQEMDYVVPEKYATSTEFKPSRLIKFINNYNFSVIRE